MQRSAQIMGFVFALLISGCHGEEDRHGPSLRGAAAGWNLILISVDTVRADRLGAYGYTDRPNSPNIDSLLASGVNFQRAMAPRALTWPSMASVLTGLYPTGHGLIANGYEFSDVTLTLPKILGAAGYQTGAVLSNMCQANHQGWESFKCTGGNDTRVNRVAKQWIDGIEDDRPFFLWAHYFGAHAPYYNGGIVARRVLDRNYEGPIAAKKNPLNRVMREGIELSESDLNQLDAVYDAAVMGTDHFVGDLLDHLREAGRLKNTLIVFVADHGEDLYQHNGYIYHACSVYQSSLHVPLGFMAPGLISAGGQVSQTVELIDVQPTILELLGLETEGDVHGSSLLAYLERPESGGEGKPAFSEYDDSRIHTVQVGDWKLVDNPDGDLPVCFAGVPEDFYPIAEVELYNLRDDPGETVNLASQYPDRVLEMRELIRQRFASLPRNIEQQEIPEELKQELEALGYVAN
ncbi:MAG: sulfatase-like hydrolase/transferase [Nitrospirae bacterium]|nr:sulfatase-like hydrolase/transferase [Nitrospirota bacterium]